MHCISWCSISLLAFFPKNCFCTNLYKKKCCLFQSCLYIVNLSYLLFICRVFNMYMSFLFCWIVYLKKTKANSSKSGGTDMILILWTFLTAVHLQYVVVCAWSCSVHGSICIDFQCNCFTEWIDWRAHAFCSYTKLTTGMFVYS